MTRKLSLREKCSLGFCTGMLIGFICKKLADCFLRKKDKR
jgi:hypothetical protein